MLRTWLLHLKPGGLCGCGFGCGFVWLALWQLAAQLVSLPVAPA
eukprot:SAG22_NODE_2019_length_3129_cov_1.934653_2_plen_44_part_00